MTKFQVVHLVIVRDSYSCGMLGCGGVGWGGDVELRG